MQKFIGIIVFILGFFSTLAIFQESILKPESFTASDLLLTILTALLLFVPFFFSGRYFLKLSQEKEKTKLNNSVSFLIIVFLSLMVAFIFILPIITSCSDIGCAFFVIPAVFLVFLTPIVVLLIPVDRGLKYGFKSKEFFFSFQLPILFVIAFYIAIRALDDLHFF